MAIPTTPQNNVNPNKKNASLGNIPVLIEDFDLVNFKLEGTNLRSGEPIEIRLATAHEIADNYMNKTVHSVDEDRLRKAEAQIKKRPTLATLNNMVTDSLIGQVVQMQGVRKTRTGDTIARWAKPITADLSKDTALRGEVEYVTAPSSTNEWRRANVIQPRMAEALNMESFQRLMSNKAFGYDGFPSISDVQSRPIIAIRDEEGSLHTGILYTSQESKETKKNLFGVDALNNIKATERNTVSLAATTGRLGLPLEDLRGFNDLPEASKELAHTVHELAAKDGGDLDIAILPGFSVNLLNMRHEAVLASEKEGSYHGALIKRGYHEVDLSLRTYTDQASGTVYNAQLKEAVDTGPLKNVDHADFFRRDVTKIAEFGLKAADYKSITLNAIPQPEPDGQSKEMGTDNERDTKPDYEYTLDAPGF